MSLSLKQKVKDEFGHGKWTETYGHKTANPGRTDSWKLDEEAIKKS